jgi:hypothetical protein
MRGRSPGGRHAAEPGVRRLRASSTRLPVGQISIELGDDSTYAICECCGAKAPSVVGFVCNDGDAFAVYFAGWTEGHPSRRVSMVIGLGDWSDNATAEDRRSFGLRCWVEGDSLQFEVQEPVASRYGDNEFLGRMLSRMAALADAEIATVFHIAEHIAEDDPRVSAALEPSPLDV